jgi:formate hydrogenlyase transcriptional activator
MDFPGTRGYAADFSAAEISQQTMDEMGTRSAKIHTASEIGEMYPVLARELKAESIVSIASAPLVTGAGPLGSLSLGSRRENSFGQDDLDLLQQIADQIALALDNALAWADSAPPGTA